MAKCRPEGFAQEPVLPRTIDLRTWFLPNGNRYIK
jgi:hypothetical protein